MSVPVQRRTSDHTILREAPEAPRVHVRTGCKSAARCKHQSAWHAARGVWERRTQLILAVARYPQHRRHWLPTRQSAHAMLSEEHRSVLQLMNGRRCDANSEVLCWFDERFAGRDGRVELAGDVGHGWIGFRCLADAPCTARSGTCRRRIQSPCRKFQTVLNADIPANSQFHRAVSSPTERCTLRSIHGMRGL